MCLLLANSELKATVNSELHSVHNIFMKYPEYAARFKQAWKESRSPVKTQKELAKVLGVAQATVSDWINGEKLPSMDTALEISGKLGCCVVWLLTGKETVSVTSVNLDNYLDLSIFDESSLKIIELLKENAIKKASQPASQPASQLASRAEPSRAEPSRAEPQQKEPSQQPQSKDRRIMTRRKPSQFEIDLAIEHERCVMERHEEAMIANERYVELIKESCKQNECYCDPPCEDKRLQIVSYDDMISRTKKT